MKLKELVRLGAQQRMAEIHAEIQELEGFLQDRPAVAETQQVARSQWTAEARQAVSVRMKAYWAAKRNARLRASITRRANGKG
jgi:hypothetical protein